MVKRSTIYILLLLLALVAAKAGSMLWQSREHPAGEPLAIRWEGAAIDYNERDVGKSINQCLGKAVLNEGLVLRSNQWFSGWSCAAVGSPDVIYSLDYDPDKNERFYCRADRHNRIGVTHTHGEVLRDLEFLDTWKRPEQRLAACEYFKDIFSDLAAGRKMLIHCDAGRDRTGTFAALLAALAADTHGQLDEAMLAAIECDYRKSRSLVSEKYGRMQHLLNAIKAQGSLVQFFVGECGLEQRLVEEAGHKLWRAEGSAPVAKAAKKNH